GWEDFLTARWLRRIDPHQKRALANFWLYVASGLWKTALAAFIMAFAIAPLTAIHRQQKGQNPPAVFMWVVLTWFFGFSISGLVTIRAVWLGCRCGVRLWLASDVHWARREHIWPSWQESRGSTNQLGRILTTSLIVVGAL